MARKFIIAEIRFFFDVEEKDIGNLANRLEIIKRLRKLRKNQRFHVLEYLGMFVQSVNNRSTQMA